MQFDSAEALDQFMDDIVNEFLVESHEGLDQLDQDLVSLEAEPGNQEILARIFRCVHTIKGTCGFLAYNKLESVAHVGENLLVRLRDGSLVFSPEIASALLALVDAIRQMLASIEAIGNEGNHDYGALINQLVALHDERPVMRYDGEPVEVFPDIVAQTIDAPAATKAKRPRKSRARAPKIEFVASSAASVAAPEPLSNALLNTSPLPSPGDVESGGENRSTVSENSIRVDVALLDRLMNLVGELVLARNQILQHTNGAVGSPLLPPAQRLDILTTELQEGVMKTRMQPIGNVWNKFPRVVRDLAVSCNKQIRLEMDGAETELDKTIIEAIKDPLTHIVRNAADHGIESPETRVRRGKPAEGRLGLRAYHEGGQVIIEISDDGAGIDADRVKKKCVERGLLTLDQVSRLSEREALNLIFLPGLSTAAAVTNISGRGVGMDVVKRNIERIGGVVDIHSEPGEGSLLKIKIPLTLAIIPALIVTCDGNRYAIPQVSLLELVRHKPQPGVPGVEMIHGAPVYRLRGNLLPLVYARAALDRPSALETDDDSLHIVVLQADDRQFGLVVDEINDSEEIVVKPLGKQLKGIAPFAGATIMGDGRVALILDVMGLAQRANIIGQVRERNRTEVGAEPVVQVRAQQNLLVCALDSSRRVAIPLSSVARLEEFSRESVEQAGQYDVVQYRGEIMPLLCLQKLLGMECESRSKPSSLRVIVFSENGRRVGFIVEQVVDIVQQEVVLDRTTTRSGILGSIVLQNRVTDVLDMSAIVRTEATWLLEYLLEAA